MVANDYLDDCLSSIWVRITHPFFHKAKKVKPKLQNPKTGSHTIAWLLPTRNGIALARRSLILLINTGVCRNSYHHRHLLWASPSTRTPSATVTVLLMT